MLHTSYLARIVKLRALHPDWAFISVTRTAHSPLAPPAALLQQIKAGEIGWPEYEAGYRAALASPAAQAEVQRVVGLLARGDVCLLCYERDYMHCHRSLAAAEVARASGQPWAEVVL